MTNRFETIAALATPYGTGGVAMIRISGPESWAIGQKLFESRQTWEPERVMLGWFKDPADGQTLDEVLCLPFKTPRSFTGEDVVEIHCHGGMVLSQTLLDCCFQAGALPAAAGEFSRRALLNGRMDLTQAEAILDLILAQGTALVKLSAANLHHRTVSRRLHGLLAAISRIQADLTASIDFPDEVDEPERGPLATDLQTLYEELTANLDRNRKAQRIREGVTVAILGLPNAGKSSLFNALLAQDRAIVTEIAGTTRDLLRETLSLQGIPVMLVDTAGLRETADVVESLGVARSWEAADAAQAILYVCDATAGFQPDDHATLAKLAHHEGLLIWNKVDQTVPNLPDVSSLGLSASWASQSVSALTGNGLNGVLDWLSKVAGNAADTSGLDALLSHRQLEGLTQVAENIRDAAETLLSPNLPLDIATVPLTDALIALQSLLGLDTNEAMLDSVFSRFCVGK